MAAECINLGKETAAMLSEDLISEILVRLPAKSLLRFRCVCKSWLHLIDSPRFIDIHLNHNKTKTDLILLLRNYDVLKDLVSIHAYESFDLIGELKLDTLFKMSGPCNGLVCILTQMQQFALYNPSTGDWLDLHSCPFRRCPKGWFSFVMGFGFGFVSNPNNYKVISLVMFEVDNDEDDIDDVDENEPSNKVEIYDLSTNLWREIECDCPYYIIGSDTEMYGIFFNGALHWTAEKEGIYIIASFDLTTEAFHDIVLPNDLRRDNRIKLSLTILNNSLALFARSSRGYNRNQVFIDIWVMKEYAVTESWTKQVSIGPLFGIQRPLMLWKNKCILLESSKGRLLSCAIDTQVIEELEFQCGRYIGSVRVYQESLVSFD